MILIAILIYLSAGLTSKWILKKNYKALYDRFSWRIPLFKLSGLFVGFIIAFILTTALTYSTKKQFIENKNAIYGLEYNSVMEEIGFEDGMKIISINNKTVYKVLDIMISILMVNDNVEIRTAMNGKLKNMVLNRNDISAILQSSSHDFIRPIMSKGDQTKFVNATFVNQNFSDVVAQFKMLWNKAMVFMNPSPEGIQKVGGFFAVAESTNIYGYGIILSFNLILLGILNLIPLPGFNVGNAIISTIEIRRRKYYNRKKKNVVGSISIALVILFLVIGL